MRSWLVPAQTEHKRLVAAPKGAVSGCRRATSEGANSVLERCDQTLGTIGVVEDQNAGWYRSLQSYKLGSTVPVLRLMIQQSNCFVVVERGAAMQNMAIERQLQKSGEMREGSNFGGGQMVAADYIDEPEHPVQPEHRRRRRALAGLSRSLGALGALAGGIKTSEASTTLLMIDNRSGVQLAAAEGTAKNTDFAGFGAAYSWAGAGASGALHEHARGQDHHRGVHRQLQPARQGGAQLPRADGQGRPGHRRRARRPGRFDPGVAEELTPPSHSMRGPDPRALICIIGPPRAPAGCRRAQRSHNRRRRAGRTGGAAQPPEAR